MKGFSGWSVANCIHPENLKILAILIQTKMQFICSFHLSLFILKPNPYPAKNTLAIYNGIKNKNEKVHTGFVGFDGRVWHGGFWARRNA